MEYDIVWTDVTYRVTQWAQGGSAGTACAWRVTGNIAELWTGTPTGAGVHRNPSVWLKPGDVVEVEVPEIGVLRNTVIDEA